MSLHISPCGNTSLLVSVVLDTQVARPSCDNVPGQGVTVDGYAAR